MGPAPDTAYHAVPNLHRPHVDGIGALFPQTLSRGQKIVRDGSTPAGDVDGDELASVGHKHEPVPVPIVAHLVALGSQPCVVADGLDLDHAALGRLALTPPSTLHLLVGVESEVGMARTLLGKLADAKHLGFESFTNGIQQVGQG